MKHIPLICLAGAESSGKSTLTAALAQHYGVTPVEEYARSYCDIHGNDLSMAQLVHIAQQQQAMIRSAMDVAAATGAPLVLTDTDAVTTAAWAAEGGGDPWFAGPLLRPDLTLVMANDLPWKDDGVRIQAALAQREAFRATLIAELEKRGHRWVGIGGVGAARLTNAIAALRPLLRPA